ncbi:MAG TPA: alpha/beta hydrolase-fold protein, partial [Candidatus Lustribacter sp.]|nr:alpha/beta hydrolase-fold protein [Candidatus Lustribacter sp.]
MTLTPAPTVATTAHRPRLAINRLKERGPVDAATVDRFLARHPVPVVEGDRVTFLFRGEADVVHIRHRVVGLADPLPLRRLAGTDLWFGTIELPALSRVEYQVEIVRAGQVERVNDPLNPRVAHSPFGPSSVCAAEGYAVPDWAQPDPEARPGELIDLTVASRALRRDHPVRVYLPARFQGSVRYPLLVVHDGTDYLEYASAKPVLDNLIHRLDVAPLVVAFIPPGDRLV